MKQWLIDDTPDVETQIIEGPTRTVTDQPDPEFKRRPVGFTAIFEEKKMRYPIWKKDDFFGDSTNRLDMDPAVVQLPEENLPLVWQYNFQDLPIGIVSDIRLEDGEITGEVEFFVNSQLDDEKMDDFQCRMGGYYKGVKKNEDGTRVLECELKCVSVMFLSATPGANPGAQK